MSTATQPIDALALAAKIERLIPADPLAAELRRLVTENQQLRAELETVGDGGVGQLMPREPGDCIAREFNTWSTNDGDSWYEHPADAQIIEDIFGREQKVGDEYDVLAGWVSVRARYRITSVSADGDCEVECISHPQPRAADEDAKEQCRTALQAIEQLNAELDKVSDQRKELLEALKHIARMTNDGYAERHARDAIAQAGGAA